MRVKRIAPERGINPFVLITNVFTAKVSIRCAADAATPSTDNRHELRILSAAPADLPTPATNNR